MKKYLKIYNEKYKLWTQLYGCIGIFGSFPVAIWEIPAYVGLPIISIFMISSGFLICGFNKYVDDMDFREIYTKQEDDLKRKIDAGILEPERLDMFRRMFK